MVPILPFASAATTAYRREISWVKIADNHKRLVIAKKRSNVRPQSEIRNPPIRASKTRKSVPVFGIHRQALLGAGLDAVAADDAAVGIERPAFGIARDAQGVGGAAFLAEAAEDAGVDVDLQALAGAGRCLSAARSGTAGWPAFASGWQKCFQTTQTLFFLCRPRWPAKPSGVNHQEHQGHQEHQKRRFLFFVVFVAFVIFVVHDVVAYLSVQLIQGSMDSTITGTSASGSRAAWSAAPGYWRTSACGRGSVRGSWCRCP